MKNREKIIAVVVVIAIAVAFYIYNSKQGRAKIVGSINLGFAGGEYAAAIYIADERGFFTGNGINIQLRPFETGLASYKAMLRGEVDVSGPTEYVVAGGVLRHEKIRAIATIVKNDVYFILGSKDRGITKASDLAGKRIGFARNTIAEFYLGRFLDLHGMNINNVTLVDMNYSGGAESIKKGSLDAIITFPPFYDSINVSFGAGVVEWPIQSGQPLFGVLTSTDDWITRNPDLVVRLLRAIDQANEYITQHPREAKAIVQKRLNLDAASIDKAWQRNFCALSLDQSLIAAMEDEARWMIKNNLTKEKTVPDFTKYIYLDGLKAVKPEAVNIIY